MKKTFYIFSKYSKIECDVSLVFMLFLAFIYMYEFLSLQRAIEPQYNVQNIP